MNASLKFSGTTTSFTSKAAPPSLPPDTLALCRSVVDQMPTTGLREGAPPSARADLGGTCSAMVLTL